MNNGVKQNLAVRWRDDPKEYQRLYQLANRDKLNLLAVTRSARNPELARARQHRWRAKAIASDPEFRKKESEAAVSHYHKNIEKSRALSRASNARRKDYFIKYKEQNREKIKEWAQKHRQTETYREQGRRSTAKRRALKHNSTFGDPQEIKRYYQSVRENLLVVCFYCDDVFNSKLAHIDHVVPLSRGGHHSVSNFCVSCPNCNLSKNDKLVEEWKPGFNKKVGAA